MLTAAFVDPVFVHTLISKNPIIRTARNPVICQFFKIVRPLIEFAFIFMLR